MKSLLGGVLDRIQNKAPVPYVGRNAGNIPFRLTNDAQTQMQAYGSVGTLFQIVSRTSNAVAQVEWKLYRKADGRGRIAGEEDRREVTSHLALDVWNRPNPFYTRAAFVESFQQHQELTGEWWWVVVRNGNFDAPLELWPVRPDRMEPIPHPTDFISGYYYCAPDGTKIYLGLEEVICSKMPNPLDPYRGMGPVQSILTDIDSARYSAEWNRKFFVNNAEPGGIIEVEKHLTDTEFDELTERWRESHQGVSNAHRVAVLEQGKWVKNGFSMRDMQFTELRNVSRDIMREAFGISKTMLGQTEDVNRATAEAAEVVFGRWHLVPRLERIKGALNETFLPMFGTTGSGLEFDYENPVPESIEQTNADRDSRISGAVALVGAGWAPDQALEVMGLPPMDFVGRAEAPSVSEEEMEPVG